MVTGVAIIPHPKFSRHGLVYSERPVCYFTEREALMFFRVGLYAPTGLPYILPVATRGQELTVSVEVLHA